MKQVVFAIALLAMASLTGCLNTDDTSVDENTDTTSDNNDNELIDPVGTDGDITIPEDSSIFIDQSSSNGWQGGKLECTEDYQVGDSECEFIAHGDDYFSSEDHVYNDADYIKGAFDFNGWVNKTGETVTIEALYFPERNSYINEDTGWRDFDDDGNDEEVPKLSYHWLGRYVSHYCTASDCEIIFYGNGGLTYNADFHLTEYKQQEDYIDTDDDGIADLIKIWSHYEHITVTFDLPFDPYGFSLINHNQNQIDRIF